MGTIPGATNPADASGAYQQWASLLSLLAILGAIAVLMLATIAVQRRLRRIRRRRARTAGVPHPETDPWSESSKRLDDSLATFETDD